MNLRLRPLLISSGLLLAAALLLLKMKQAEDPQAEHTAREEQPTQLDFRPSEQEMQKLEELRQRLDPETQSFPEQEARSKDNAKLFTFLAKTSEDREVILASLRAMQTSYGARSDKKAAPSEDLDRTLLVHLDSEDPEILALALETTRAPIMSENPGRALLDKLLSLASPASPPEVRYAALSALNLLRPDQRDEGVLLAFEAALTASETAVVAQALLSLSESQRAVALLPNERRSQLARKMTERAKHSDPSVRGRALLSLSRLAEELPAEPLRAAARDALTDPSAYARGAATALVAALGDPSLAEALLPLVADEAETRHILKAPTLQGTTKDVTLWIPGRQRVGDGALHALRSLAQTAGVPPLDLGQRPGGKTDLSRAQSEATAWLRRYGRNDSVGSSRIEQLSD